MDIYCLSRYNISHRKGQYDEKGSLFFGSREEIHPSEMGHDMPFQTGATFEHFRQLLYLCGHCILPSSNLVCTNFWVMKFSLKWKQLPVSRALMLVDYVRNRRFVSSYSVSADRYAKFDRVTWICWKLTIYDSLSQLAPTPSSWGA